MRQPAMTPSCAIKQTSLDRNLSIRETRKKEFLAQMERVVRWTALVERIVPCYPAGKNGRPLFSLETKLRAHFMRR